MFIPAIPFAKILLIFEIAKGLTKKVLADSDFCGNGNLNMAKWQVGDGKIIIICGLS